MREGLFPYLLFVIFVLVLLGIGNKVRGRDNEEKQTDEGNKTTEDKQLEDGT